MRAARAMWAMDPRAGGRGPRTESVMRLGAVDSRAAASPGQEMGSARNTASSAFELACQIRCIGFQSGDEMTPKLTYFFLLVIFLARFGDLRNLLLNLKFSPARSIVDEACPFLTANEVMSHFLQEELAQSSVAEGYFRLAPQTLKLARLQDEHCCCLHQSK